MAVTDYDSIFTELNSFTEAGYTEAQVDTFIGLADGEIGLALGPNYTAEVTTTVTTDADGEASLPAGFVRFIALSQPTYGNIPLGSWDSLTDANPLATSATPARCAISGSLLKVAPSYAGALTLTYEGAHAPLTAVNTTNWLIERVPNIYFYLVMAQAKAFEEELEAAAGWTARGMQLLSTLSTRLMVGQHARSTLRLRAAP